MTGLYGPSQHAQGVWPLPPSLTDAVVSQVPGQALFLVFRVILALPHLELFTGEACVLSLPLQEQGRKRERERRGWGGWGGERESVRERGRGERGDESEGEESGESAFRLGSTVRRLCVGWELEVLYLWASVQ